MSEGPKQGVDAYIRELRGSAPASRGEFTLSRERALAEAQKHQLAQPRAWVLFFVRAAVRCGAERVE